MDVACWLHRVTCGLDRITGCLLVGPCHWPVDVSLSGENQLERADKCRMLTLSQATALTACGTFALAGGAGGVVRMWNAQSGVLRRVFKVGDLGVKGDTGATGSSGLGAASTSTSTRYRKQSDRTITGIATDALNTVLVASTLDGTINVGCLLASNGGHVY